MIKDTLDLGRSKYDTITNVDANNRDENGYYILKPTAKHIDNQLTHLTTNIDNLEEKLKEYRKQKSDAIKFKKTDDYKESKKEIKKKKKKKEKETLLQMVFNNADSVKEEEDDIDEDDAENYRDNAKTKAKNRSANKKQETTLDTTYGKRFSAVVSMLYDTVNDFDSIAIDLENELKDPQMRGKTMYRSSQTGNLISAKSNKLSAIKEIVSVAKTVSDLEYKKDKDKQGAEGSDSVKAVASIGAKFLRGGLDTYDDKKKKKSKKMNKLSGMDDDDDDYEDGSIKKATVSQKSSSDQKELASEFANSLLKHKDDIKFTPHEKFIDIEGSYSFVVAADSIDPENSWHFIAVDTKSGKEIPDFKEKYKDLYPKKKACRMSFDLGKLKCTDRNSGKRYKLVLYN